MSWIHFILKMSNERKILIIKLAYWLGIVADAFWAAALSIPSLFGISIGRPDFEPDFQTRSIMWIGAILMTGWTLILIWAVKKPIARRVVILITAVPVVSGLLIVAAADYLNGNSFVQWIIVKCTILIIAMIASYVLSSKIVMKY